MTDNTNVMTDEQRNANVDKTPVARLNYDKFTDMTVFADGTVTFDSRDITDYEFEDVQIIDHNLSDDEFEKYRRDFTGWIDDVLLHASGDAVAFDFVAKDKIKVIDAEGAEFTVQLE